MPEIAKIAPKPKEKCNLESVLEGAREQENRVRGARMPEMAKIISKSKEVCNLELVLDVARQNHFQTERKLQSGAGFGQSAKTGKPRPWGQDA